MNPGMTFIYTVSFLAVILAMTFAVYLYAWVKKQPCENRTIKEVSALINQGANTFMRKE